MTNPRPLTSNQTYLPQLDGLRALAVLSVMQHHWAAGLTEGLPFAIGSAGVQLFFVISGFLITGILLRARERAAAGGSGRGGILRAFYARRSLRIFPLYYGVILVLWIIGNPAVQRNLGWLLSYTFNIKLALSGEWVGGISHLWSLAVEEQFYLLWPWLVLFLPRRKLIGLAVVLIVAAPVIRVLHQTIWPDQFNSLLLFENTDALCLGGLLALLTVDSTAGRTLQRYGLSLGGSLLLLSIALIIWLSGREYYFAERVVWSIQQTGLVVCFTGLVAAAARGIPGVIGRLLSWEPVVYIGTISYGLYVYHPLMLWVVPWVVETFGLPDWLAVGGGRLLLLLILTFGCAALSWHLFERPINELKRNFPYTANSSPAAERRKEPVSPTGETR